MDHRLLAQIYKASWEDPIFGVGETDDDPVTRLDERNLQLLLQSGHLGIRFTDDLGRNVDIVDFGEWNHSAGPDFLRARILIDGEEKQGDIELDPSPEDWERHGHGGNPDFERVILHLVCFPPRQEWFTRNARHERIPMAVISRELMTQSGLMPIPDMVVRECAHAKKLAALSFSQVEELLKSAAAYRFRKKQRRHRDRLRLAGEEQTLYEHIAETLGYHANKKAMLHLAMRAPLRSVRKNGEAILFGTAGFLLPILPAGCSHRAIEYHRELWEQWWPVRDQFELSPEREFPWVFYGIRPGNHPQRRMGALATIASEFDTFRNYCRPEFLNELSEYLSQITHHYWSKHMTLPSAPFKQEMPLIGKERIREFIVNHVLPADGREKAWKLYLGIKAGQPNSKVLSVHRTLLGERDDAKLFLSKAWHHQALLQIHEDLCLHRACGVCSLADNLISRG